MTKRLDPYERLNREAVRNARKMYVAFCSARLSGDGFANEIPDFATLWEDTGRYLFECAAQDGISIHMRSFVRGMLGAYDASEPPEVREAIQTILRLATVDGKAVAPLADPLA